MELGIDVKAPAVPARRGADCWRSGRREAKPALTTTIPALVIQSKDKMTVPILIATLRGADYMNFDMGKIYTMIMVAIVPIILVYLFLSKYIIAGVTLGGVKE